MKLSVLMSVYYKEKADYLDACLQSLYEQTCPAEEIVCIKDGKLTPELDATLDKWSKILPMKIIAYEENKGLAYALNLGVRNCSGEYIARMDTDDIAMKNRFEKQLDFIEKNPDIAVFSGYIAEFVDDPNKIKFIKKLPITHEEIARYIVRRNPFNHMAVCFKKEAIIDAGNYQEFPLFEDYDLWTRVLNKGYNVANIPEILVKARIGNDMIGRRHGFQYARKEKKFLKRQFKLGFIGRMMYSLLLFLRVPLRLLPKKVLSFIYYLLRDNVERMQIHLDEPSLNIMYICDQVGSAEMGMVFRPYYLSKEWVNLGHNVTIIANSFVHNRKKNPDIQANLQETDIDGIRYVWIKTFKYRNLFERAINMFSFIWKLKTSTKKLAKKYNPDVVISACAHNMDIYSAAKIAKYANAKLVYEVRDLWPLSPMEIGGYTKYNPMIRILQRAENTAYKKSDFVVSVLPCVHEHMSSHGLELKKLHIIPNGIDEEEWLSNKIEKVSNPNLSEIINSEKNKGNVVVGYTGAFASGNAMSYLLEAAKLLKDKNVSFVLVGSGKEKEKLYNYAQKNQLKNVFFFDPIPKNEIPSLLSHLDILYIGWNDIPIYRFGISPNKIMDYMMASKPIMHSVTAGNDPVADAGCGLSVEAANPKAIADGIMKLASLTDEERKRLGQKGHDYILKHQTYRVLAQKFLDMLNEA